MTNIISRLSTFSDNRLDNKIGLCSSSLARLGYVYRAEGGIIECWKCHHIVENAKTTEDEIINKHKRFNSQCEFSNKTNICQVDLSSAFKDIEALKDRHDLSPTLKKTITDIDIFTKRFLSEKENVNVENLRDQNGVDIAEANNDAERATFERNREISSKIKENARTPSMVNIDERYMTFKGKENHYSHSIYADIIKQLVDAGFYYIGPTDNVRCFYCDGGLKNFTPDDKPFEEHQKWFPSCKLVKYIEQKRAAIAAALMSGRAEGTDTTSLIKYSKHPIMFSTQERLESFKGQEQKYKHCERANVEDFVNAGLFYVGPLDVVRCFYCSCYLGTFPSDCDPLEIHKASSPGCKFALSIQTRRISQVNGLQHDYSNEAHSGFDGYLRIPGRVLEENEVIARLDTPLIQSLIRTGYAREVLRRAIERRFALRGEDFKSAQEMIKDIIDIEGEEGMHQSFNQERKTAAAVTEVASYNYAVESPGFIENDMADLHGHIPQVHLDQRITGELLIRGKGPDVQIVLPATIWDYRGLNEER